MTKRVLQIGDDRTLADQIRLGVEQAGFHVITQVKVQDDISTILLAAHPDLVVLSTRKPDASFIQRVKTAITAYSCPTVVFASRSTDELTRRIINTGVSAYIVDGFSPERVSAIFSLACARFEEVKKLKDQLKSTKLALSERKLLDKAKGILMEKCQLNEEQAYRKLRNMAMTGNMKISQVARNVISMATELGPI